MSRAPLPFHPMMPTLIGFGLAALWLTAGSWLPDLCRWAAAIAAR